MQQHPQLQMPMLEYHSNLNTKWPSWNPKTTKVKKQEDHYGKCANKCNKLNMQQRAKKTRTQQHGNFQVKNLRRHIKTQQHEHVLAWDLRRNKMDANAVAV